MELIDIAREFLEMVSGELDPYTRQKGEIKQQGVSKITLFTPAHIQFARYGRGPGKKPPLDPILEWVKREGIVFDGASEEGTAFAIQASIGKKGTKNWVPNAPNALDEAITKNIDFYNKSLAELFAIEIHDSLQQTYKKILPDTFKI